MAGEFSTYLKNAILNAIANATSFGLAGDPYVSLHTADPGVTGTSEVTGGSYARQQVAFGAASAGAISNSAIVDFTGMPAATVTYIGIWDAASGGNFLWGGPLASSKTVNSGDTARFAAGDLDADLNP